MCCFKPLWGGPETGTRPALCTFGNLWLAAGVAIYVSRPLGLSSAPRPEDALANVGTGILGRWRGMAIS
eukprot:5852927-Pyramimonas_sp.AAC.1